MWGEVQTRVVLDIRASEIEQPRHVVERTNNSGNLLFAFQFLPDRGEFILVRLS